VSGKVSSTQILGVFCRQESPYILPIFVLCTANCHYSARSRGWLVANKLEGHFARNPQWQTAFLATRYQMADDGSKTASGTCARCQRPTMNRCTGCLEAPVYDECVSKPTFYCSPLCQKADWGQHKSECRKLQARKALGRAALLLQAIIYRIRLHASPLQFKSMRIEGSIISLDGFQVNGLDTQRLLKPFPVCLDGDKSLFEAVLVYMGCMEAMMYLHSFTEELLAGEPTLSSRFSSELDTDLLI
jgi:hypothetical protein